MVALSLEAGGMSLCCFFTGPMTRLIP